MTGTVLETVGLYQKEYDVAKIAKIRGLGLSTIFEHLTRWYENGGDFNIDKYVKPEEEKLISEAIQKADNVKFLGSIKRQLPEEIGYEKIRMVIAKRQRKH